MKIVAQRWQSILALTRKGNDSLKSKIIKGVAGSFGLNIALSGLSFMISILFARFLGTVGLGTYSYATTWANILGIPARLGIDQLLIREVAIYRSKSQWGLLGGLLRWANSIVLIFSVLLALISSVIVWTINGNSDSTIVAAIALAMMTIPIISLRTLRLGAMKGLHKVVLGQVPDSLIAPTLVIVLTSLSYLFFSESFNVFWVLIIKIVVTTITLFIGARWLWKSLPAEIKTVKPQYQGKVWLTNALPFMFLGAVQIINSRIDIIMLGGIRGVKEVGIYAVIVGIAQLTIFIHHAALSVLGPNIATLYSEGKFGQLEKLIQKSVLWVFLISLIVGGTIILLSKYLLLIFGTEFVPGRTALIILILGQIFHALTGPVGMLLNMTGKQNYTAATGALSAILNIILNFTFIPLWGINGAAVATTTSLTLTNMMNVIITKKKLNLSLYSFSSKKKSKKNQ